MKQVSSKQKKYSKTKQHSSIRVSSGDNEENSIQSMQSYVASGGQGILVGTKMNLQRKLQNESQRQSNNSFQSFEKVVIAVGTNADLASQLLDQKNERPTAIIILEDTQQKTMDQRYVSQDNIVQLHAGKTQTYLVEGSSEAGSVFDSSNIIHSIEPNMRYEQIQQVCSVEKRLKQSLKVRNSRQADIAKQGSQKSKDSSGGFIVGRNHLYIEQTSNERSRKDSIPKPKNLSLTLYLNQNIQNGGGAPATDQNQLQETTSDYQINALDLPSAVDADHQGAQEICLCTEQTSQQQNQVATHQTSSFVLMSEVNDNLINATSTQFLSQAVGHTQDDSSTNELLAKQALTLTGQQQQTSNRQGQRNDCLIHLGGYKGSEEYNSTQLLDYKTFQDPPVVLLDKEDVVVGNEQKNCELAIPMVDRWTSGLKTPQETQASRLRMGKPTMHLSKAQQQTMNESRATNRNSVQSELFQDGHRDDQMQIMAKTEAYISVKKTVDLSKQPPEIASEYYGQPEDEGMNGHKFGKSFNSKSGVHVQGNKTPLSHQSVQQLQLQTQNSLRSKSQKQKMFTQQQEYLQQQRQRGLSGKQAQINICVQSSSMIRSRRDSISSKDQIKLIGSNIVNYKAGNFMTAKTSTRDYGHQYPQIKMHFAGLNPRRKLVAANNVKHHQRQYANKKQTKPKTAITSTYTQNKLQPQNVIESIKQPENTNLMTRFFQPKNMELIEEAVVDQLPENAVTTAKLVSRQSEIMPRETFFLQKSTLASKPSSVRSSIRSVSAKHQRDAPATTVLASQVTMPLLSSAPGAAVNHIHDNTTGRKQEEITVGQSTFIAQPKFDTLDSSGQNHLHKNKYFCTKQQTEDSAKSIYKTNTNTIKNFDLQHVVQLPNNQSDVIPGQNQQVSQQWQQQASNIGKIAEQFLGSSRRRPRSIPPAMHGYIKNHATRGIVHISKEEIDRQKRYLGSQVTINGAETDDQGSKNDYQGSNSDEKSQAILLEQQDTQYFRLDTGEQFENLQQMIDQTGPLSNSDQRIIFTNEIIHNDQEVPQQAVDKRFLSNEQAQYRQNYATAGGFNPSSSNQSVQHMTPQFTHNSATVVSNFVQTAKQAAIYSQDRTFDIKQSMFVTKIMPQSQLISAKELVNDHQYQQHNNFSANKQKVIEVEPSLSPSLSKKVSVGHQTSNVKVTTEVFLSKVRMLSPDSKNSRSFPHISAFPGSETRSNKSGIRRHGSKGSNQTRSKQGSNELLSQDMKITGTVAIEVEQSESSAVTPLLIRGMNRGRSGDQSLVMRSSDGTSSQQDKTILKKNKLNSQHYNVTENIQGKIAQNIINLNVQSANHASERKFSEQINKSPYVQLQKRQRPTHSAVAKLRPSQTPVAEVLLDDNTDLDTSGIHQIDKTLKLSGSQLGSHASAAVLKLHAKQNSEMVAPSPSKILEASQQNTSFQQYIVDPASTQKDDQQNSSEQLIVTTDKRQATYKSDGGVGIAQDNSTLEQVNTPTIKKIQMPDQGTALARSKDKAKEKNQRIKSSWNIVKEPAIINDGDDHENLVESSVEKIITIQKSDDVESQYRKPLPIKLKAEFNKKDKSSSNLNWKAQPLTQLRESHGSSENILAEQQLNASLSRKKSQPEQQQDLTPVQMVPRRESHDAQQPRYQTSNLNSFSEGVTKLRTLVQQVRPRPKKMDSVGNKPDSTSYQSTLMNTVESPFMIKEKRSLLLAKQQEKEQVRTAAIIQVISKQRRASTTMQKMALAKMTKQQATSSQVSSKDDNTPGGQRLQASYKVIREIDSQVSGSGIINIQRGEFTHGRSSENYKNSAIIQESRVQQRRSFKGQRNLNSQERRLSNAGESSSAQDDFGSESNMLIKARYPRLAVQRSSGCSSQRRQQKNESQRLLKRGNSPLDNYLVGHNFRHITTRLAGNKNRNNQEDKACSKDSRVSDQQTKAKTLVSSHTMKPSTIRAKQNAFALQNQVKLDQVSQTTLEIKSQNNQISSGQQPQAMDKQTLQQSLENYLHGKQNGNKSFEIIQPHSFQNNATQMVSMERENPYGKQTDSNFLNRHERLKLQQKKLKEDVHSQKCRANLLVRKQKPQSIIEEENQQKLRSNQAVKRDIKFACKRSTTHIRTKLQRKCEKTLLVTSQLITEPVVEEDKNNKLVHKKGNNATLKSSESYISHLKGRRPVGLQNINSTDESECVTGETTGKYIKHVIPTSKFGQMRASSSRVSKVSKSKSKTKLQPINSATNTKQLLDKQEKNEHPLPSSPDAAFKQQGIPPYINEYNSMQSVPGGAKVDSNDVSKQMYIFNNQQEHHFSTERMHEEPKVVQQTHTIVHTEKQMIERFDPFSSAIKGQDAFGRRNKDAFALKSLKSVLSNTLAGASERNSISHKTFVAIEGIGCSPLRNVNRTGAKDYTINYGAAGKMQQGVNDSGCIIMKENKSSFSNYAMDLSTELKHNSITGVTNTGIFKQSLLDSQITSQPRQKRPQSSTVFCQSIVVKKQSKREQGRLGYSGMLKMSRQASYKNQFFVNQDSITSEVKIPYRRPGSVGDKCLKQ